MSLNVAMGDVSVAPVVEGSAGLVTYDYVTGSDSGTIQAQPWTLEDGTWKYDTC